MKFRENIVQKRVDIPKIVEKNTENYKTDLDYDLDRLKKAKVGDSFIWFARQNGTHLWETKNLFLEGCPSRASATYWYSECKKAFLITITDASSTPFADMAELKPAALCSFTEQNELKSTMRVTFTDESEKVSDYDEKVLRKWNNGDLKSVEFEAQDTYKLEDVLKAMKKACRK